MVMQAAVPFRERAASGVNVSDRDARFHAFVQTHQDRAVRVAWRLLGGDDAAAEDVAQEAFLRAHRGLDRFRDDASIAPWFYGVLVNEARRYRRWRAVRARWNALWEDDVADPNPRAEGDPALRRRITAAVDRLPRGQREAFVLAYLEGFSIADVARQLGKAEGTIKSHLHRALGSLRNELKDLSNERDGNDQREDSR